MALVTDRLLFLHIPKTGGTWVREAINALHIPHYEIVDKHAHFPNLIDHVAQYELYKRYLFTFIRHPLTWYQSRWTFRMKNGWQPSHPLDFNCASNDFNEFVENTIRFKPEGWVTSLYKMYIDDSPFKLNKIGLYENLKNDLLMIFRDSDTPFDVNVIDNVGRINSSDIDGATSREFAKYDLALMKRVLAVEQCVINTYYHNFDHEVLL